VGNGCLDYTWLGKCTTMVTRFSSVLFTVDLLDDTNETITGGSNIGNKQVTGIKMVRGS
jgi:hypothetical protein